MTVPFLEELENAQDEVASVHKLMHSLSKDYPEFKTELVGVAVSLTDAIRKLDRLIEK